MPPEAATLTRPASLGKHTPGGAASGPAGGGPPVRDRVAGVKMLGGLLRLDALQPDGFTAEELAGHAGVKLGTVQSFLKPSKGTIYAEAIDRRPACPPAGGRPRKLYRLVPEGRARVIGELVALRRAAGSTGAAGASRPAGPRDVFEPLALLEAQLAELLDRSGDPAEFDAGLADAAAEVRGCEAELAAMVASGSGDATVFARRLGLANFKLSELGKSRLQDTDPHHAGNAEPRAGGLFHVGRDCYVSELVAYESSLRSLRNVIIASDSPAPPVGEMRTMMMRNIQRGAVYRFLAPFEDRLGGAPLKDVLEAYRVFEREIADDKLVRKRAAARTDLHQSIEIFHYSPPEDLQHMIFYEFMGAAAGGGDCRMEVLIRQGADLDSPFLLVRNESIVAMLYLLVYSRVMEEVRIPKDGATAEDRIPLPEPITPSGTTKPPFMVIRGGLEVDQGRRASGD